MAGDPPPDGDGNGKDADAAERDRAASRRDDRATERDARADIRDRDVGPGDADRRAGAADRALAAEDRRAAWADRLAAERDRVASCIDGLTGAHRRDAGIVELEREVTRARRTEQSFALAFVDLDDLKGRNDARGHLAGDELLRATADSIRARLRSYDLIIRFGGDEFLCALMGVELEEVARRFSLVNADLARTADASISVGVSELQTKDALEDLIARADLALYRERRSPPASD